MSTTSAKTPCPVSRDEFLRNALPFALTLPHGGGMVPMEVKQFSTKSLGWGGNGSATMMVGNVPVKVQIGFNVTLANSKDLPDVVLTPAAPTAVPATIG